MEEWARHDEAKPEAPRPRAGLLTAVDVIAQSERAVRWRDKQQQQQQQQKS